MRGVLGLLPAALGFAKLAPRLVFPHREADHTDCAKVSYLWMTLYSSFSFSVFDREDETTSRQGSLAALERRQAEKKKELMKAQSLPKTSATQARKAMIEKLEKESGG